MSIITIIEVVVEFMVDTYRSMLLCTIELAVRGTLEVLIAGVKTVSASAVLQCVSAVISTDTRSLMGSPPH